jgi:hypothetical protein|tara:strand:- start:1182 stop:1649 length:468 start_codon:yes stop_codon:yes gene_type:complete
METISSNERKAPIHEILMLAAQQMDLGGVAPEIAIASVIKEASEPNAEVVQVGNTMFLGHYGKEGNKKKVYLRAFNVDVARNFLHNGMKYLAHLQDKGVTHVSTQFSGEEYLTVFKLFGRFTEGTDTDVSIARTASGKYQAYIKVGNDPLQRKVA